jgi:cytochrome P450
VTGKPSTSSIRDLEDKDPYRRYEQIRNAPNSAIWDERLNAWVIADYESCAEIHREESLFHHPYENLAGSFEVKGERSILLLKGEEHRRLHAWYSKWFRSRAADVAETVVRPLAARLLGSIDMIGSFDLTKEFADPLPVHTLGVLFGLQIEDDALLNRCKVLNDRLTRWSETFAADDNVVREAIAAADELAELLGPVISQRRAHPQDDLVSDLWRDGPSLLDNWDESTMMDQAKTLFPAGGHTTANYLCNVIYLVLSHPELVTVARDQPGQVIRLVEEGLRLGGPIHLRVREARRDVSLSSGLEVHAGQRVHPLLAAAGRDPGRHACPVDVDLMRDKPRHHMAFGLGPRLCVGAELARAIGTEALSALAQVPGIRLDPHGPKAELTGFLARSYRPVIAIAG